MKLSKLAEYTRSRCWSNGEIRVISPTIGFKYDVDGKTYVFTEEVYEELLQCDDIKVTRFGKSVNIIGL